MQLLGAIIRIGRKKTGGSFSASFRVSETENRFIWWSFLFGLWSNKLQNDRPVDWRIRLLDVFFTPWEGQSAIYFFCTPPKKVVLIFGGKHEKRWFWSNELQQSPFSSHLATAQQMAPHFEQVFKEKNLQELSESVPQTVVIILPTQNNSLF